MTDTKISDERLARALGSHTVEQMAGKILRRYEKDVPPIKQFLRDGEDVVLVEYVRELLASRHQEPVEPAEWQVEAALEAKDKIDPFSREELGMTPQQFRRHVVREELRAASIPKVEPKSYPTADRHYDDIDDPRKTGLAGLMEPAAPQPAPVVTEDMVGSVLDQIGHVRLGIACRAPDITAATLELISRVEALTAALQKPESKE